MSTMADPTSDNAALKQMGEMKSAVAWVYGVLFVVTIFAMQETPKVNIFGVELTRTIAFWVIACVYVALCAIVAFHFDRVSQHFSEARTNDLYPHFVQLEAHEWIFNPFFELKSERWPRGYFGFFALIVLFWVGVSGLYFLIIRGPFVFWWWLGTPQEVPALVNWLDYAREYVKTALLVLPIVLFIAIGDYAMKGVIALPRRIAERLEVTRPHEAARLRLMAKNLKRAADIGIGIGGIVFSTLSVLASLLPSPQALNFLKFLEP